MKKVLTQKVTFYNFLKFKVMYGTVLINRVLC